MTVLSNTTKWAMNHQPETSESSLERTCLQGTPLWELNHHWVEIWPPEATRQETISLVNLSTISIPRIVSLEEMPQLDGWLARKRHAQPEKGGEEDWITPHWASKMWRWGKASFVVVALWGSLEFGKGEKIHMGRVSLSYISLGNVYRSTTISYCVEQREWLDTPTVLSNLPS